MTNVAVFLSGVLLLLGVLTVAVLVRLIVGPRTVDRMVCVNMITTFTVMMFGVLAYLEGESYIADLNLIYAALGFVSVAVLSRLTTRGASGVGGTDANKSENKEENEERKENGVLKG